MNHRFWRHSFVAGLAFVSAYLTVPPVDASAPRITENFRKLPLSFEATKSGESVRFVARGDGYSLLLADSEAVLAVRQNVGSVKTGFALQEKAARAPEAIVRMRLLGARATVQVTGEDKLPGVANYLVGDDRSHWRTGVETFARVRYTGIYSGVDLLYYGNHRQLEYDFAVAPGASPTNIRLGFFGGHLRLDRGGNLIVTTANGHMSFHKPEIYQEANGKRQLVAGTFVLFGRHAVGFSVGAYDPAKPLIIDPVLVYDFANVPSSNAIAIDASGCAYVTGATTSLDVTSGAYQNVNNGTANGYDNAFVAKINAAGTALVYATYLGGSGGRPLYSHGTLINLGFGDSGNGIAVDSTGNAYVTGLTYSVDFPVTSRAFQTVNQGYLYGDSNAFITKLNATGTALIYSTFLGGEGDGSGGPGDWGNSIALDALGNAYVTGYTASGDFPVTPSAFQTSYFAGYNSPAAFVTKVNPTGAALVYSSYLGGPSFTKGSVYEGGAIGNSITVDTAGNAYLTGRSFSGLPVTVGAFQTNYLSTTNNGNAFVSKVNPAGTALVYSTYLGGSGYSVYANGIGVALGDVGSAIAVDGAGNAYVTGSTGSSNFPTTPGAFQTVNSGANGSGNAFVTKLNATGNALIYSTYLGGNGSTKDVSGYVHPTGDSGTGIAVDATGNAYVTGSESSADFPVTPDGLQEGVGGFAAKLNPAGTALIYSTYLGEGGTGIALDLSANAYIAGQSGGVMKLTLGSQTGDYLGTMTTVTANANPGCVNQNVTLTASVRPFNGSAIPTGTVLFNCSGCPTHFVPINGMGEASVVLNWSTVQSVPVFAVYSGDSKLVTSGGTFTEKIVAPGIPVAISAVAGASQIVVIGNVFPTPMQALVTDAVSAPVAGVTVTFTVGPQSIGTGSGSFSGSASAQAVTNSAGIATAPAFTADSNLGSYYVTATVAGVATSASFSLSNVTFGQDYSSLVKVTTTGFLYSRVTKTFTGTITVTNLSAYTLAGSFAILLSGLPTGVSVANPSGLYDGNAFLTFPGNSNNFAPGQPVSIPVQFNAPKNVIINFTTTTLAGYSIY